MTGPEEKRKKKPSRRTDEQLIADLEVRLIAIQERVAQRRRRAASRTRELAPGRREFSPSRLASHRKRLGLSATEYGALVGVMAQTIYAWESGRTRPRARLLEAITALQGLSKRAAWARLSEIQY